jgi:hypothetical protein
VIDRKALRSRERATEAVPDPDAESVAEREHRRFEPTVGAMPRRDRRYSAVGLKLNDGVRFETVFDLNGGARLNGSGLTTVYRR